MSTIIDGRHCGSAIGSLDSIDGVFGIPNYDKNGCLIGIWTLDRERPTSFFGGLRFDARKWLHGDSIYRLRHVRRKRADVAKDLVLRKAKVAAAIEEMSLTCPKDKPWREVWEELYQAYFTMDETFFIMEKIGIFPPKRALRLGERALLFAKRIKRALRYMRDDLRRAVRNRGFWRPW